MVRPRSGVLVTALALAVAASAGRLAAQAAPPVGWPLDQLLASARQGKGLCIHLGCGSKAMPSLTADLAAGSQMLVHGLAIDDASADVTRKAIESKGVTGQASVEKGGLAPLPYMPNLANLVVIDDWDSLSKAGLTKDEALRVLAPEGTLWILQDGRWTSTVKPRPAGMDDWRYPMHDAGLTRTSRDKTFSFPIGLRWTDGVPNNLHGFTGCCGCVVVKNTLFTLSSVEAENLGQKRKDGGLDVWLVARDAFNGLPLWKINLGYTDKAESINASDVPALAADETSIYTAAGENKVIRVDAKTGKVLWEQPTKHKVYRLVLMDGVVVAGSWSTIRNYWYYYYPDPDSGSTAAFDAATGRPLWQKDYTSEQLTAGDGVVHIQLASMSTTQPANAQAKPLATKTPAVIGVDLKEGKELWRVEQKEGDAPKIQLISAGPKYVVVTHFLDERNRFSRILDSATGKVILDGREKKMSSGRAPMIDGLIWFAGHKIDPATGEDRGTGAVSPGFGCTPNGLVWPYLIEGRGGSHTDYSPLASGGKPVRYQYNGARAACLEGMVIANGMLYNGQNGCKCMPSHIYGFLGLAPCGSEPTAEDFARPRPVEKGPAWGMELTPEAKDDGSSWPMLRADAARSASSKCSLPGTLKEVWSVQVTPEKKGPLAAAWDSQLTTSLSAPIVADGLAIVSACDLGQVIAYETAGGRKAWTATLASRIDGPPTYWRGLCIVGCHDGDVYALRAKDGQLVWQAPAAPLPRRIVAHGRIESVWPAPASVLVQDGVVYATAGRTSESDGGVALVALDAATGKTIWARQIGPGALRLNDILAMKAGQVAWRYLRVDKATGETAAPASMPSLKDTGGGKGRLEGGLMDGTYTMANNRRAGGAFELGGKIYDLMAWNDHVAAVPQAILSADGRQQVAQVSVGRRVMAVALAQNAAVYALRLSDHADPAAKSVLKAVSVADGKIIQELPLSGPTTYDGLAIAGGKLFVASQDGRLACLGQ
ncbi:MAG: PQQ-binding-like beta-propeller repeat protein [Phycisphaerae bacterium]